MRTLTTQELRFVSGAGESSCCDPCGRTKNNNGYGNGAESGRAPGNSGAHNPQLLTQNSGPKGPR
jgi:hypothetical protein